MAIVFALLIAIIGPIVGLIGVAIGDPLAMDIGKVGLISFTCFFLDHMAVVVSLYLKGRHSSNAAV
jgi:hypothetical protein